MIVRLAGKGCVGQADALAGGLLVLTARRAPLVTLDLSGLECVASLSMGVLVTFRQGVIRGGGRVRLAPSFQEPVRAALERAGLLALFDAPAGPDATQGAS
jgi:anti-anti-sigma regulatory factor